MRERVFTTHQVATLLGTNPSSVVRWVDTQKLPAFRTPGGHRRVSEAGLRTFLTAFGMPVPAELGGEGQRRILLVDADGRAASALARALRKAAPSVEVTTSTDALEALVRVGASPPDALAVDAAAVDVAAVAKALRGQPSTAEVALYALISKADAEQERKLRSAGAKAVVPRAAAADSLAKLVAR